MRQNSVLELWRQGLPFWGLWSSAPPHQSTWDAGQLVPLCGGPKHNCTIWGLHKRLEQSIGRLQQKYKQVRVRPKWIHSLFVKQQKDNIWDLFLQCLTNRWEWPLTSGPPPSPRAAHSATRAGTSAYIFGGRHMETRSVIFFFLIYVGPSIKVQGSANGYPWISLEAEDIRGPGPSLPCMLHRKASNATQW